jgi:probable HAF family extracellular repeat protein
MAKSPAPSRVLACGTRAACPRPFFIAPFRQLATGSHFSVGRRNRHIAATVHKYFHRRHRRTFSAKKRLLLQGFSQIFAASMMVTAPVMAAESNVARDDSRAAAYCLFEIGRLPGLPAGEVSVEVAAINQRDQITGLIAPDDGSPSHAFQWDRKRGIRDLGAVPGHASMNAAAINDAGTVVGDASDFDTGESLAFVWTLRGGIRSLDTSLGGVDSFATDVNQSGQIVGGSATSTGTIHAFLRDVDGGVLDLGAFPGGRGFSSAEAMNDRGQVVGTRVDGEQQDAFIWDERHGMQSLVPNTGPEFFPFPSDINNRGEVAGALLGGESQQAFRWTRGEGVRLLGTLSGVDTDFATASAINNWGTIVGGSQTASGEFHGFVWNARSGMRDLNELIDVRNGLPIQPVLGTAVGINDAGSIAVSGILPGEDLQRGYLMVPKRNRHEGCR